MMMLWRDNEGKNWEMPPRTMEVPTPRFTRRKMFDRLSIVAVWILKSNELEMKSDARQMGGDDDGGWTRV